jgi:hypothetical protein
MTIFTSREIQAIEIDIGVGVVGFLLSLLWGKITGAKITSSKIKMFICIYVGITVLSILAIFVMRRVP